MHDAPPRAVSSYFIFVHLGASTDLRRVSFLRRFKLVHGLDSPWGPYVRTLSHVEPSVKVLRELRGTYADEARREWDTRVKAAHEWITETGCGGALRSLSLIHI